MPILLMRKTEHKEVKQLAQVTHQVLVSGLEPRQAGRVQSPCSS